MNASEERNAICVDSPSTLSNSESSRSPISVTPASADDRSLDSVSMDCRYPPVHLGFRTIDKRLHIDCRSNVEKLSGDRRPIDNMLIIDSHRPVDRQKSIVDSLRRPLQSISHTNEINPRVGDVRSLMPDHHEANASASDSEAMDVDVETKDQLPADTTRDTLSEVSSFLMHFGSK